MPKEASTHGASAPSKSNIARAKTGKAKSKDKAASRKEVRKAASEAASKAPAESDEVEEEGASTELQAISNVLDEPQERYQVAQLHGATKV
ncbi:hypothetical protein PHPALM_30137 [Phytophthora palmivora]|uniref:ABC Superfamily n=1 Tax=Phytophthora palmivora TaxID=4796 RepID=A0A2P4X5W4_9STRA|nr:hypothetical protein PHPALM_30137 [Phytophthora palmivora]